MQKTIIITADLGHLKAYRVEQDDDGAGGPRMLLLSTDNTDVARHLSALVSDKAGQFRKLSTTPPGQTDRSDGEPHHLGIERRKRALKALARDVDELLSREQPDAWCLAAASEINKALVSALDQRARARMQENVRANLTGVSKVEVLSHFNLRREPAEPSSPDQGNVPRKSSTRRTNPLDKAMRRQTIGRPVAREMARLPDKGDRRRSKSERHDASAARSRRLRAGAR